MRLACLMTLMTLCIPASSCIADEAPDARPNSLAKGAKALQVDLRSEPYYEFSSGIAAAMKVHDSDSGAMRVGLEVRWRVRDWSEQGVQTDPVEPDAAFSDRRDQSSFGVTIDFLRIGYAHRGRLVNLYWGAGPTGGFERATEVYEDTRGGADPAEFKRERTEQLWTVGIKGLVGIEWFAIERVSLFMEYRASAYYSRVSGDTSETDNSGNASNGTIDGDRAGLESSAALIGLGVYF